MERTILFEDDFAQGFDCAPAEEGKRWSSFAMGPFSPDDAIVDAVDSGIVAVSRGKNPKTGEPAFVRTVARPEGGQGLPGTLDHLKWSASVNHATAAGAPGFEVVSGKKFVIETRLGGRVFGLRDQPFGDAALSDLDADFRLGAAALVAQDPLTNVVFDFFITNNTVYAIYERVDMARMQLGNYAAYTYAVPVASRKPEDMHDLRIVYDPDARTGSWQVDGVEKLFVDKIGSRIDRTYMAIDRGGEDTEVVPGQINCGLGTFTILDGALNGGPGLVDLGGMPDFYDPQKGEGSPLSFVDPDSREESRVFGQGVELRCEYFRVSYE